ncbi:MAG: lytic transglycosylase domain-containing protein [Bryobacterales bacterium]|nr:lytic transglycosylase domain-containing protein [Bryobacterales bacterium]
MTLVILILVCSFALGAQPAAVPPPRESGTPAKAVRQRMEESISKQKQSIRKQVEAAQEGDPGWFTVPWSNDSAEQFIRSPQSGPSAVPQPGPAVSPTPTSASLPTRNSPWCDPIEPAELATPINVAATREGISPELIRAVIAKESAFTPCAISNKGAQGLMQLMPATAAALGVMDPFNPEDNVNGGAKYLKQLLSRYSGDLRLALGAYNAGPARVDQYGDVPPIAETQNYVNTILRSLQAEGTGASQ